MKKVRLKVHTPPSWWQNLEVFERQFMHAGHKIYLTRTALTVLDDQYCYICGDSVANLILEKDELDSEFHIHQIRSARNRLLTRDHVVASSNSGVSAPHNYKTCCEICNLYKGNSNGEPVLCWGFVKHAQSIGKLDDWKTTSGKEYPNASFWNKIGKLNEMKISIGFIYKPRDTLDTKIEKDNAMSENTFLDKPIEISCEEGVDSWNSGPLRRKYRLP